jgi:hypothetical protein
MKQHQPQPQASAIARASQRTTTQQTLFNTVQHGLTSDDYYTPPWIFEKLAITFDLDVASPTGGCHWIPATHHYDQQTNGLTSDWYGNVFMNPPFSKITPWVTKFIEHHNGIALLPMSKSHWFDCLWLDADGCLVLERSLKFINPTGKDGGIFIGSMLFAYGQHNVKALHNIGRVR